jgi:hypothetical protein
LIFDGPTVKKKPNKSARQMRGDHETMFAEMTESSPATRQLGRMRLREKIKQARLNQLHGHGK